MLKDTAVFAKGRQARGDKERLGGGRQGGLSLSCMQTPHGSSQVRQRCVARRHQAVPLDANHCWQSGGLTPPIQVVGLGASQEAAAD